MEKSIDYFYITLYALIGAVNLILIFLSTKILGIYTEGGIKKLRNLLSNKIAKMKIPEISKLHSGDYASRATNDINNTRNYTYNTLPELMKQPILTILAVGLLFYFSWKLTLIIIVTIPILFVGVSLLNKPLSYYSRKRQEKYSKINSITTDYIRGVEVSKAYNIEEVLKNKYNNAVDESILYEKKLEIRNAIIYSFSLIFPLLHFLLYLLSGVTLFQKDM